MPIFHGKYQIEWLDMAEDLGDVVDIMNGVEEAGYWQFWPSTKKRF
jgi:hypothetical protein